MGVEPSTLVHVSPEVMSVTPTSGWLTDAEKAGLPFQVCDPDTLTARGAIVTVVVPLTKWMA